MKQPTNEEWIEQFAAYLKRRYPGRSTATHYVSDMRSFLRHYGGALLEVTRADMDSFVDGQRAASMAPATVKRRAASLKSFFDFLAEEGVWTGKNPVVMKRHAGRQPQKLPRDLKDEEVARLLAVVSQPRDLALVSLLLYGGLRVEEVVSLTERAFYVPRDEAGPVQVRVLGKGRKERLVYLVRPAYAAVETYVGQQPVCMPDEPLFRSQRGQPLTIAGVQWLLRGYAAQSGVAVTAHRLRHTCARWLAEGEMPVLSLARFLGHSQVQTTQRYIDGANPQVRQQYQAAMQAMTAPAQPEASQPVSLLAGPTPVPVQPVTVSRPAATAFKPPAILQDLPTWLGQDCLAWVQRHWFTWKASRRQANGRVAVQQVAAFWRWQLPQRAFTTWSDLQTSDVAAFIQAELARGRTAKTIKDTLDSLYSLLRDLHQQGRLSHLPARPALALPDPLPRHLSPTELFSLETHVHQVSQTVSPAWLDIALYYLLAHAGLRVSEALDLQVQDVDLTNRRLRVVEGKNRRDRVVYLTTTACQALGAYLTTVPHAPADLLLSRQGRPLSYYQAWRLVHDLGQGVGLTNLSPLRLRHTFATFLLNNGATLEVIRQLMGHENLQTTLIYARLADATVERQYRSAMDGILTHETKKLLDNSL